MSVESANRSVRTFHARSMSSSISPRSEISASASASSNVTSGGIPARTLGGWSDDAGSWPLYRGVVQRFPEVDAGEGAVRPPGLGDPSELVVGGQLIESVLHLDSAADAQIPGRQHVGALELEHEEHLGAPDAEAADRADLGDHLLVRELGEPVELELTGLDVVREVADVFDLPAG